MKAVAKYNTFKGVSTLLTLGTPIITLACYGDFFVHRSDTAISAAGIFTLLICALFFKDKIIEVFKTPSALILSVIVLALLLLVENIMLPIKNVCIATIITSTVDELTFKRWYKQIERKLPETSDAYKRFGFLFTTTDSLMGDENAR